MMTRRPLLIALAIVAMCGPALAQQSIPGAVSAGQPANVSGVSPIVAPPAGAFGVGRPVAEDAGMPTTVVPPSLAAGVLAEQNTTTSVAASLTLTQTLGVYFDGYCQAAIAGKCLLVNSATVPSAGALAAGSVLECAPVAAGGVGGWTYATAGRKPSVAVTGFQVLYSIGADCYTYTAGSAYIHGAAK